MSGAGHGASGKEWLKRWTTVLSLAAVSSFLLPLDAGAQRTVEESRIDRAIDLIRSGNLDDAESMLRQIDEDDTNYWLELYGLPAHHWVAQDYLLAIERIRHGDESDVFFSSARFRFHLRGMQLDSAEQERVARTFEEVLSRVAAWANDTSGGTPNHRLVFVELAESFPTPSPARTLIFFWDRQDRAPRMEITRRAMAPNFLAQILAHELTHAVLPHTLRPLAEGVANLAARQIFPNRPNPIRARNSPEAPPWSLDEVLLFNVRAQGAKAQRQIDLLKEGGFSQEAIELTSQMYKHGDDFVAMVLARWGQERLMTLYHATNEDPSRVDILAVVASYLAPVQDLRIIWDEWLLR